MVMYGPEKKVDWFGISLLAGSVVIACILFGVAMDDDPRESPSPLPAITVDATDDHPSIEQEIASATAGMVGSPVQDLRAEYASAYRRVRAKKLDVVSHCEGCGISAEELAQDGGELQTHHVTSVEEIFHKHLDPELISDPDNLIVLCRNGGCECHFHLGHDPDGPSGPASPSWSKSNPNVRRDCANHLKAVSKTQLSP